MKFPAALSLGFLAPAVLAKAVHNVYPAPRDLDERSLRKGSNSGAAAAAAAGAAAGVALGAGAAAVSNEAALLAAAAGLVLGSQRDVVIIWVNTGNGASTTTVNQVSTVTQTVTAGAAAGTQANNAGQTTAATTTGASAATTVASGAITTHSVNVGGAKGLVFEPDQVTANVGDMVVFTFLSQNHTATQSSFAAPCVALDGGMDSGFQPNPNNSINPPPQVAMQVMVSTPLWFYCKQGPHCGLGMVMSINPTANKTQALFQQMAIAQNGTGTGGAITGNGGSASGGAANAGASSSSSSSSAAAGTAAATKSTAAAAVGTTLATSTAAAATGAVTGIGSINADGSCSCVVQCAVGSFPAVQAQGVGAFGGMPGSLAAIA